MPSSSSTSGKDHAAPSSSFPRRSSATGRPEGSTSSSAATATLSSALTQERRREVGRRSRYQAGPRRTCYDPARALGGLSPRREGCYASASTAARSFSSSVLTQFREWKGTCFTGRPGRRGGAHSRASKAGTRNGASLQVDMTEPAEAAAARLDAKPLRERVPAEAAAPAEGNAVARGGRSTSSRRSGTGEGALGLPPASASTPALPQGRGAHGARGGRGRMPPAASAAVVVAASGGGVKEKAFVWADRYRPKALEDFICNRAMVDELRQMVHTGGCDHFIFEGPPGVGKRTMISALLREVFGPERSEPKDEVKIFKLKGEIVPRIQANVKTSPQHIEINLSELHGYERHAVVALIKGSPRSTSTNSTHCDHTNCQAIVVYKADKLSIDSQNYIRWLMEKHKACFKIIFCCSDSSKLQPVKQLCKVVKLRPPSQNEIVDVLKYIAKNEEIDLPYSVAKKIADTSKENVRQAIRSFEASWQSSYPFKEDQEILTGWEEEIAKIAKNIVEEQSPKQLYSIREKLKNLIEHNVSPHFIFNTLQRELKKHLTDDYHTKLDEICEEYKNDVQEGRGKRNDDMRSFMTIEEFTAKFMSFYKSNVVKNVEGKDYCSV